MKIWDNDKKEFEEDLPTNLETGLSIADKLLSIAKKLPSGNGYKNNILKTSVLLQSLQEETKQKDRILYAIIELRKVCIFRKNCASVPEERSAIPLQTEQSSVG